MEPKNNLHVTFL